MNSFFKFHFLKVIFFYAVILLGCQKSYNKQPSGNISAKVDSTSSQNNSNTITPVNRDFSKFLGVNTYEWDVLQNPSNASVVNSLYLPKFNLFQGFSAIRHYLDWYRIEQDSGKFTYNPAHNGGWYYDVMYQGFKNNNILVLTCLKNTAPWIVNTYPTNEQIVDGIPAPFGSNLLEPASYIDQARAAFQFAARYGSNPNVDPSLVQIDASIRWTNDEVNQKKIGLGLVNYLECDNERDKWWLGPFAEQSGAQYAANMSAFYDGDLGRLGKDVGVKNADPNMQVVMGGLSTPTIQFVKDMVSWCQIHRGLKPDGSVNLCFDIINYHYYSNNYNNTTKQQATQGVAPELNLNVNSIAQSFLTYAQTFKTPMKVWITEHGFDINSGSTQRAVSIGNKSALVVQADWALRSALLYSRVGLDRAFYYQMYDAADNQSCTYCTSGLSYDSPFTHRPSGDYVIQANKLIGNYSYVKTLSSDPAVDVYQFGSKTMYVCWIPDQIGRTGTYNLNLGSSASASIHTLVVGSDNFSNTTLKTVNGQITINLSETPIFVEGL